MSSCLKKTCTSCLHVQKNVFLSKDDICIPNAQYSSFSAQQNLCREILEF